MTHPDSRRPFFIILLCALLPIACNNSESRDVRQTAPQTRAPSTNAPATLFSDSAGAPREGASLLENYRVVYAPEPDPIPMNEPFTLYIAVYEKGGTQPLTDIDLVADAAMPQHQHGMNTQPTVTPHDTGLFVVRGMQFHMPGYWELYIDITRNGITERAQFEINLE